MVKSFVDRMEELVDIIADWGVQVILESIQDLTTDGRPFGMPKKTPQEQINTYMQVRDDPQKCFNYIDGKARELINQLINSGVPETDIAAIHPYDIVISYALTWSAEMEALIAKEGKKNAKSTKPGAIASAASSALTAAATLPKPIDTPFATNTAPSPAGPTPQSYTAAPAGS